jgi:uncharacterized membrane protein YkoI
MTIRMTFQVIVCTLIITSATVAFAFTGQQYASQAKITLKQARAIALKAFPGKITDQELERERGGSGLRYSFDIKRGAVTHEVGVDARTGAVLENSIEGPHSD